MKLLLLAIIALLALSASEQVPPNAGLPLVQAKAACPAWKVPHPCERVKCGAAETEIA